MLNGRQTEKLLPLYFSAGTQAILEEELLFCIKDYKPKYYSYFKYRLHHYKIKVQNIFERGNLTDYQELIHLSPGVRPFGYRLEAGPSFNQPLVFFNKFKGHTFFPLSEIAKSYIRITQLDLFISALSLKNEAIIEKKRRFFNEVILEEYVRLYMSFYSRMKALVIKAHLPCSEETRNNLEQFLKAKESYKFFRTNFSEEVAARIYYIIKRDVYSEINLNFSRTCYYSRPQTYSYYWEAEIRAKEKKYTKNSEVCILETAEIKRLFSLSYYIWGHLLNASFNLKIMNNKLSEINHQTINDIYSVGQIFNTIIREYFTASPFGNITFHGLNSQADIYYDGLCNNIGKPSLDLYQRLLKAGMIGTDNLRCNYLPKRSLKVPYLEIYLSILASIHQKRDPLEELKNYSDLEKHMNAFRETSINGTPYLNIKQKTECIVYLINTVELIPNYFKLYKSLLQRMPIETPGLSNSLIAPLVSHKRVLPDLIINKIMDYVDPTLHNIHLKHSKSLELLKCKSLIRGFLLNDLLDKNFILNLPIGIIFSHSILPLLEEGATVEEVRALRKLADIISNTDIKTRPIWKKGLHVFLSSEPKALTTTISKADIEYRKNQEKRKPSSKIIFPELVNVKVDQVVLLNMLER